MIGPEQTVAYRRDGFLHLPGFFAADEVHSIRLQAANVFRTQFRRFGIPAPEATDEPAFTDSMQQLFQSQLSVFMNCGKQSQHLIALHRLSLEPRILETLDQLGLNRPVISTRPVLFFNSRRLATKDVYWRVFPHQDWRSMQGSLDSVVVWLPLMDITSEIGPLDVIPGSHRDGLVTDSVVEGFGQVPESYLANKTFRAVPCRIGDALFFSSFLVHQSGTNVTDRIRWSCHFRYNNLDDPSFIERGYVHPYLYKPSDELLTPDYPVNLKLKDIFPASTTNAL